MDQINDYQVPAGSTLSVSVPQGEAIVQQLDAQLGAATVSQHLPITYPAEEFGRTFRIKHAPDAQIVIAPAEGE